MLITKVAKENEKKNQRIRVHISPKKRIYFKVTKRQNIFKWKNEKSTQEY